MNYFRFIAIGSLLAFGLTGFAGESSDNVPGVEEHLKMLSARLDLTSDQQARIKPVLVDMMGTMQALERNQSLSSEQREERMAAAHQKADKQAREILNDEQKKKLDQLERESGPQ